MARSNCARCGIPEATLLIDGKLMVELCDGCRSAWLASGERSSIMAVVGHFLGRPHPLPGSSPPPVDTARLERDRRLRETEERIAAQYVKGMVPR